MATPRPGATRPPSPPRTGGRGSRVMLFLILGLSVCASLIAATEWGAAVVPFLVLGPDTLVGLKLTSLFTNSWVNLSDHPNALFMPIAMLALFRMRELPFLIQRKWKSMLLWAVAIIAVGTLVNETLVPGVWGILGALLITALMAPTLERMFGPRPFLWFCARVVLVTNLLGATLLWLWPGSVMALLAGTAASPSGISPLTAAWFLTFVLVLDRRALEGIDVALNGRVLAILLVVLSVYGLLFTGFLASLMDLVGLALAWMHVHAGGSPRMLLDRFRLWRLARRRARFRVVPGGRDDRSGGSRGGGSGGGRDDGRIVHRSFAR